MFYFFNVFLGTATEAFPHMDELSMSIDPEQAARAFVGDQPLCVQRRNSSTSRICMCVYLVIVTIYFCRNTEAECCGEMNAEQDAIERKYDVLFQPLYEPGFTRCSVLTPHY